MVRRLYVEKKNGYDVEAQGLFSDVKESLNIDGLKNIRVINRYDIDGIDDETYEKAKFSIFAEPAIDVVYEKDLPDDAVGSANFFAVEYLPGQYDQRADSAEVCISLMNPRARAEVRFARVIVAEGDLSEGDMDRIKDYTVNPVDSQLASLEKLDSLELQVDKPEDVRPIDGFTRMDKDRLMEFHAENGFAMSQEDMLFVADYFKNEEQRNPTITELKVIDTYWSDHCRHTTFNTALTEIEFEDSYYGQIVQTAFEKYMDMRKEVYGEKADPTTGRPVTLMDMAVIGAKVLKKQGKADAIDESEEINACSIKVKANIDGKDEDWVVMFKNETHNHPTEIEPFGGAATCLGGAIRDPLSGRAYVYQAMRVTGGADPRTALEDTLEGKLPQKKITREAAAGYSSYGNQIGLATGQVSEVYHENYVAKRMEVGAVVGAAPASNIVRKRPEPGDVVILLGGRTGRDGCGGATGSSKEHTTESINECGAEVQKGNPPVERNIQRLFRRPEVARMIKRCNDFGAGGVSVAVGELADGLDINLDAVPKKYEGLDGTELAISESQERMAVVVAREDFDEFIKYADQENLEAMLVAKVTDTNRVVMNWKGRPILDLSRDFLNTNGVMQETSVKVQGPEYTSSKLSVSSDEIKKTEDLGKLLDSLTCAGQKGLIDRFDSTIGAATVLMPLGGKYQDSPSAGMAAKLPLVEGETKTATIMAYGFDPELATNSPFHGAQLSVVDSITKLVAMGGRRKDIYLSFQEYFEKLTGPASWGKPMAALLGALEAQIGLESPAIGGKDSMSGSFEDIDVPPSLLSFAICATDADRIVSSELKAGGNQLLLLKTQLDETCSTDFEAQRKMLDRLEDLIGEKKVLSTMTVGKGGAFMALIKMAIGNRLGFEVSGLEPKEWAIADYGSVILEVGPDFDANKELEGIECIYLGQTKEDGKVKVNGEWTIDIEEAADRYAKTLEPIFPTKLDKKAEKVDKISYTERNEAKPAKTVQKPRVIIPTFPGTNCEVDSARAFERAGAEAHIFILRNRTAWELERSIADLAKEIKKSQILMLPGGFSGGDEPDGSAKFITAVFRHPKIKAATADLVEKRDGLIIGICNGFQALIKLGLVPFGKIVEPTEDSPTLTYNEIGRHMSTMVRTRIASVKSPWMKANEVGDIFTIPVSHGEGRFICKPDLLKELVEKGQIATQYVDLEGEPTMELPYNPNGSVMAVECITSPDGRIIGKMGHAERVGENLYKNIVGEKDMKLFESAVAYFRGE